MSRYGYVLLGLMLMVVAACSRATKQEETPPAEQQTQSAPAPEVAAPQAPATETTPVVQPAPAPAPAPAQQPIRKAASPAPRPAPKAAAQQPAPATVQPSQAAPTATAPAAEVKPPEPRFAVIPSGSSLHVRLDAPLDSSVNKTGETFRAIVDQDVVVDGKVIAPRGSLVEGKLTNVERSGRVEGRATMSLELTQLSIGNQSYPLQTSSIVFQAESTKKQDATKVGVGAGLGAVIGAIAGGGKGAAIGAAVGAGAGGATVVATRGKEVRLEAEHKLNFELRRDVSVRLQ